MLALIAGSGALPAAVAAACHTPPLVCAYQGFDPENLSVNIRFRLETLGSLLDQLEQRRVTHVCLCGAIRRPVLDPGAIDAATMPYVDRLMAALGQGDDGALRVALALFGERGMSPIAAHVAAPDLLPAGGVLTRVHPTADISQAAVMGDVAIDAMGRADLGQSCIVSPTAILLQEDESGTDALLTNAANYSDAVFYKAPKPGQDRRADLPVIGPGTARGAVAAGLSGLIIEAGGVMVLHQAEVLRILDDSGLFLWVRERPV